MGPLGVDRVEVVPGQAPIGHRKAVLQRHERECTTAWAREVRPLAHFAGVNALVASRPMAIRAGQKRRLFPRRSRCPYFPSS